MILNIRTDCMNIGLYKLREMANITDYCRTYDLFFETENNFRSYMIFVVQQSLSIDLDVPFLIHAV